jgi:hypothetical protein
MTLASPTGTPDAPPTRIPTPVPGRGGNFELELGEFTQIGAVPLIDDANHALVGARKPVPLRTSAPSLPPPIAMSLPDPEEGRARRRGALFVVLGVAILVGIALLVVFGV